MKREIKKIKDGIMRRSTGIFHASRKRLKSKKGFTLIEIIVVLVILAILAAAAIPTMLGFVDDARGKAEIANARAAYLACQAIATEEYLLTPDTSSLPSISSPHTINASGTTKLDTMLGADMDGATVGAAVTEGRVSKVVYATDDYTITIEPSKAAVVTKNP